mgnify:CR=1 FL=1
MIPIHPVLDGLLNGGLHPGIITTVYGPAGSGKTNIAVLAAVAVSRLGKKTVYIDTEGGFSIERVKQIANDSPDIIKHILFLRPTTFTEQKKAVEGLANIDGKVGLIIVDSISMLYRLEMGGDDVFDVNRALGKQLAGLISIAAKRSIPILLTNQVYSAFDERNKVSMVGGDLLRYGSKCLVELQITPDNKRRAILRKHPSDGERTTLFSIVQDGIAEAKESRGFKLF